MLAGPRWIGPSTDGHRGFPASRADAGWDLDGIGSPLQPLPAAYRHNSIVSSARERVDVIGHNTAHQFLSARTPQHVARRSWYYVGPQAFTALNAQPAKILMIT